MAYWRGTASQQAQDDLDGLLDPALGFAQQQLDAHGEFDPYAVVVDADGQQRMVAADIGSDEPASADLITKLIATLSDERDNLRAAAIVAHIRLPETNSDAVRVTLEHSERVSLTVLLPYKARQFGRGIDYGNLQASAATAFIWPAG
ncbi:hypothetical protein [Aeromicrobium yanjiei]|uniref:Uncharacterized protein n=1 Tax=Aeromicrobium yanjiei TaxID=2662028 RepID=A0A5Q2ME51_9ACTN|nr:hypothetical protein [Aeromicrobium yanjiei]QGG39921.1 hypothetical protein GEV26_00205 [Aeromicrobium yanjiei]